MTQRLDPHTIDQPFNAARPHGASRTTGVRDEALRHFGGISEIP